MNRKQFIRQCGFACAGVAGITMILPGCSAGKQVSATIVDNQMQVPLSSFIASGKNKPMQYKGYVIARNEQLNYPVVIYRNAEDEYTAMLLRCSHQYAELNVNGELLTCSAHGSEFDKKGNVVNGPAEAALRSFRITKDTDNIYIHLV